MLWLLLLQVWASCLWLGHSEVVNSFESSCPQFFYENMPPTSGLLPEKPALICQTFKNKTFYATLYDRNARIPVYSAYIYEPGPGNRSDMWLVEPQLIRKNLTKNMEKEKTLKAQNVTTQEIEKSQAVNQDYYKMGFDRGHLNPVSQHNTSNSKDATFTLTNAVPMNITLNRGAWRTYEVHTMCKKSKDCQTTYVIVGAVPGNSSISNGRVNVPSHIWASACCKTKDKTNMTAWGAIAMNNKVQILKLGALETQLAQLYNRGQVSLFHSDCPR